MEKPCINLPKLGQVYLIPTSKTHIYVDFNGQGAERNPFPVTTRGISWQGSIHMYLWADGKFHVGPEDKSDYDRRQAVWLRRLDQYERPRHLDSTPSDSTWRLIVEATFVAVNEWAADNKPALLTAEAKDKLNDWDRAREAYNKAKEAADKAYEELVSANAAYMNAKAIAPPVIEDE